eukprot:jgi/Galph1/5967/GphlegSOOS_G4543.1
MTSSRVLQHRVSFRVYRFLVKQKQKAQLTNRIRCGSKAASSNLADVQTSLGPNILLCPGQGAQYVGMGKAWQERSQMAEELFEEADDLLSKSLPKAISEICADSAKETIDRTDVAQPAIFLVSYISWIASKELGIILDNDACVKATAGLSLGEYTALVLAGAMTWQDALRLVQIRGMAMQKAAENTKGGMVALIGATETQALECCDSVRQNQVLIPANYNSPGQIVLSGDLEACNRAIEYATTKMQLKATPLAVAGAFHSPLMASAREVLQKAIEEVEIRPPKIPVMCNVTGKPHESSPIAIRQKLTEQLTSPVKWAKCMEYLLQEFSEKQSWVELAPGKTLTGIMRRINKKLTVSCLDDIFQTALTK